MIAAEDGTTPAAFFLKARAISIRPNSILSMKRLIKSHTGLRKWLIPGFFIVALGAGAFALFPFMPLVAYEATELASSIPVPGNEKENNREEKVPQQEEDSLPLPSGRILVIPKIGVNITIVEGLDEGALERGAWRLPETSTPEERSNTVLTAHRFKYRPPSSKTFYLLDKLEIGDTFSVYWDGKEYKYRVSDIDIVPPTAIEVLNPSDTPIVTLITCHPLFSQKERLVVKGELM